jgi:hypothetical protein
MILSDGALPIPDLNSKVDRWIAAQRATGLPKSSQP